jgi:DNA-binding YbaB/EbfC family protein
LWHLTSENPNASFFVTPSKVFPFSLVEEIPMMKGGIAGLVKQAQLMQENMKKVQDELALVDVEGQSGAGMVKVTMTCAHVARRVTIDASALDDKEMLEDLVVAAVNDALHRAEETSAERLAGFTAKMKLPSNMKLPF